MEVAHEPTEKSIFTVEAFPDGDSVLIRVKTDERRSVMEGAAIMACIARQMIDSAHSIVKKMASLGDVENAREFSSVFASTLSRNHVETISDKVGLYYQNGGES